MSWASWTTVGPSLLLLCAILAWWYTEPKTAQLNLIVFVGCVFFLWAVNPELARDLPATLYRHLSSAVLLLPLDRLVATNVRMLGTGVAVVWLLRRAFQTLWKPVPELIGILGLEVPACPDVSLTGIAADKATLTWSRAQPSRPVQKYQIQVNGVNVGEIASNQEHFIIVSGLKPDHFYNVRVIAVGANNFQAGSRVIRLRTFAGDGRPQLGNSRLPSNFSPDDQNLPSQAESVDENGAPRSPVPMVAPATGFDSAPPVAARDANPPTGSALRRNTVGRRHSPSTTSMEQVPPPPPITEAAAEPTEAQMDELGEKYKNLLRETEDVVSLVAKEEEDHKQMLSELEAEKQEKKKEQKKKEEQTEKLRREQGSTERLMRNALQRKAQKEKILRDKLAERSKLEERMANFEKGIEEMRKEQSSFTKEKEKMEEQKRGKEEALRAEVGELLSECGNMETELKERRAQVKELEDARKKLPGGEEDAEWRERDAELRRDWHRREKELQAAYDFENKRNRQLEEHTQQLASQLQQIQIQQELFTQANASGVEFGGDHASMQMKRRSRTSNSMSNVVMQSPALAPGYPVADAAAAAAATAPAVAPGGYLTHRLSGPPGFAAGPFTGGVPADAAHEPASRSHEADIRALMGDAPLSPTAKSLLPSHIFMDMDMDDDALSSEQNPFAPPQPTSPANDPQSPSSSNRSMSILSSPHGSSHNLAYPAFSGDGVDRDRRSVKGSRDLGVPMSSPLLPAAHAAPPSAGKSLASILKFQRSRGAKPPLEEEGPALGSLKPTQSQSFPRQTEEPDLANRRRISLSSWNGMFNRNSAGPELIEGRAPPPVSSNRFSARNLFAFGGSRAASGIFSDGGADPSSPRPASIASSDLPRPSTESGAIWGPPADNLVHAHAVGSKPWPWSPPENTWSSRNPSRRPSIHGSPAALKTTLASADDEILDEEALMKHHASPSQVGVIGSRPPAAKKTIKSLNPAAPTFMTNLLNTMTSKDKSKDKVKESKEKPAAAAVTGDESPSDSRISREAPSIHTQTSVSESRESLSLDQPVSNTLSDLGVGAAASTDSVVKKLFRKSSSSKFSFSSRLGKKGPGSVANSDKNAAADQTRLSIGDMDDRFSVDASDELNSLAIGRSYDSVTSSPSLGPFKFSNGASPAAGGDKNTHGKDKDKDRPESRTGGGNAASRWFSIKKKGRDKDSLEIDRERAAESEAEDKRRASRETTS